MGTSHCHRNRTVYHVIGKELSVVKARVRHLLVLHQYFNMVHAHISVSIMTCYYYETERFTFPPMHLIKLYLSSDKDGWDSYHQQKQRLIGRNYAG